jgi:hypothetical protein
VAQHPQLLPYLAILVLNATARTPKREKAQCREAQIGA